MKKLLLCTPIHDSKPLQPYVESVDRAVYELRDQVAIEKLPACGDSLVSNARNIMVGTFLRDSDADTLLFVDADESFTPRDVMAVVRGLDAGMPIVGAAYAKKIVDWECVHYAATENGHQPHDLARFGSKLHNFNVSPEDAKAKVLRTRRIRHESGNYNYIQIEFCGTGFLGATRKTLKDLASEVETYQVRSNFDGVTTVPGLFEDYVKDGRFVGEDVHFCKLARKHGFSIHLFVDSQVSHWGLYEHKANARAALAMAGFRFEIEGEEK